MDNNSALERFSTLLIASLPSLLKVVNTWLLSILLATGCFYLFFKERYVWGGILSVLTAWQFINFSIARTVGLFLGIRSNCFHLKYEEIPQDFSSAVEKSQASPASFMMRLTAYLVDIIILLVPRKLSHWAVLFLLPPSNPVLVRIMIDVIICLLYFSILPSSTLQGTFGMKFVGLRVCNYNYEKIGWRRSFARAVVMLFSVTTVFGCIMIIFTKNKQSLHDLLSKTYVVEYFSKNRDSFGSARKEGGTGLEI